MVNYGGIVKLYLNNAYLSFIIIQIYIYRFTDSSRTIGFQKISHLILISQQAFNYIAVALTTVDCRK